MHKELRLVGQNQKMELFRLETEPFGTNAYIVLCRSTGEGVLVDAPGNADIILQKLKDTNLRYILLTHSHMDHIMALEELYVALGAPLAAFKSDAGKLPVMPDRMLADGDTIACGKVKLTVIHTPGHTAGSTCFWIDNYLLSGDTIFTGGPGKTASPQDFKQITASIREKVLTLPDETIILPGHGDSTDVKKERALFEIFSSRDHDDQTCGDVTWLGS